MVPRGCRRPPRPAGRGCCFSGRERIARRGYFGSPRQDLNIAVENANKRLARGQERSDSSSLSIRSRGKSQRRAERCWEGRAGTGAGVGVALPARGSQALGCSVPRPRRPQQHGREDAGSWGLAERSLAWLGSSVGSWPGARYSSEPDPGNSGCSDNAIWSSERASGRKPETQLFLKKE